MTISGIGSQINSLQALRAKNAFINNIKQKEQIEKTPANYEEDVKVSIQSRQINQNTNNTINENNNLSVKRWIIT